jgi:hypothetical protein
MAGSGNLKVSHYAEPAGYALPCTPSDTVLLTLFHGDFPRSVYVGVTGNLTVVMREDETNTPVLYPNAAVGYHPLRIKYVMATGTVASGLVVLY